VVKAQTISKQEQNLIDVSNSEFEDLQARGSGSVELMDLQLEKPALLVTKDRLRKFNIHNCDSL
jgi:hypothetical protein